MISRRDLLATGAGTLALSLSPAFAAETASLDALGQTKGLRFGAAMNFRELSDPQFCALMRAQCGVMVTENEMKWPAVQPAPDTDDFSRADALAAFAKDGNILLRGHNLLWQKTKYIQPWILAHDFGADPRAGAEALLGAHIKSEIAHFPQVQSWDVVNEAVDNLTGEMRETVFTQAAGQEILEFAYRTARAANPAAQLVYNDYMTWEAYSAPHRGGVLRFLERMRKNNVPIDALGLQSHIGSDAASHSGKFGGAQEKDWSGFLDEVAGMGYGMLITEFDVNDDGLPGDIATRDRTMADYARAYLDVTLANTKVKQMLCWGLVNHHSWLQSFSPRKDGLPKRPLPFDENYQPTPIYGAIAEAFKAAPDRR